MIPTTSKMVGNNHASSFFMSMRVLDNLQRATTFFRSQPYGVSNHMYHVALLAWGIADGLNKAWAADGVDTSVNVGDVLQYALVHDMPESIAGDVPQPTKEYVRKKSGSPRVFDDFESQMLLLHCPAELRCYLDKFQHYVKNATLETRIVGVADVLELGLWAVTEYQMGNRTNGLQALLGDVVRVIKSMVKESTALGSSRLVDEILDTIEDHCHPLPAEGDYIVECIDARTDR